MFLASPLSAEPLRIATFNTELQRDGPGLLLRDLMRGEDAQIAAVVEVIAQMRPHILALQGIDYDLNGQSLAALRDALRAAGADYPYSFAARPNTGLQTGLDMDGDGRIGDARDAQSYGRFSGQGGMAVISLYPIMVDDIRDFSTLLWRDVPDAQLPYTEDGAFPSEEALAIQRLSTTGHWVVPVNVPDVGRVDVMTFHASPPVFDGPEDRNGKRNHDEILFWQHYLDGAFGERGAHPFVLLGDFNLDPDEGEGLKSAIQNMLRDTRLLDPAPSSAGSAALSPGDPFDTVDWDDPIPGNMRVDYVLPSAGWTVRDAGVYWPEGEMQETVAQASRHRLVWVDLER